VFTREGQSEQWRERGDVGQLDEISPIKQSMRWRSVARVRLVVRGLFPSGKESAPSFLRKHRADNECRSLAKFLALGCACFECDRALSIFAYLYRIETPKVIPLPFNNWAAPLRAGRRR